MLYPKDKFIDITLHILDRNMMINTINTSFEYRPKVFDVVSVNVSITILALMIDYPVNKI